MPADKHQLGWTTHFQGSFLLERKICSSESFENSSLTVTAFSFSSQIKSLLEENIHCSFKALSQLQVKGSQGHLALWRFVDVKAPPNLDDPPRVEDHLPVVQGVAVLDHQGDLPPGKAAFQFRELSLLFFTLLRAFARQQSDGGKGGAIPKNATQIKRKQMVHPYQKKTNGTP